MNQLQTKSPNAPAAPTLEQQQAFATYRAALSNVKAHDRMDSFRIIAGICQRLNDWGKGYEDQARLALAYTLDDVLATDPDEIDELERECGIHSEFGHIYCARRSAFKREWGL